MLFATSFENLKKIYWLVTKLQWAGPFRTGVFMGFTHVFSGPGSACVVKASITWVPKPSLMEWPLPYQAQPFPWLSAGDLLFRGLLRSAWALLLWGLLAWDPSPWRAHLCPPTGASSPDQVVANHTTLTNTMLRWWEENHPCQWRPELTERAFIPWLLPCRTLAWKCLATSPCGPRSCFSGFWPTAVPFAWVCDRLPPGLGVVRASVVQPWELHRPVFSCNSTLAFVINSFFDSLSF